MATLTTWAIVITAALGASETEVDMAAAKAELMKREVERIVPGNNEFAFDLYHQLAAADADKNLFFSPYSISTALAMTYAGALGTTAMEFIRTMHIELPAEQLHPACGHLIDDLNALGAKGTVALVVANALWAEQKQTLRPAFVDVVRNEYKATIERLNFAKAAAAAKTINDWVAEKTKNRIQDLVSADAVQNASLVLTNAIYFKGKWASPFDAASTKENTFTLAAGKEIKAPLMTQRDTFAYMETPDLQLLELGYADDRLAMLIVLPRKLDGLAAIEQQLSAPKLDEWTRQLRKREVIVTMPRFTMTQQFDLGATLRTLGLRQAFNPAAADFRNMVESGNLYLSTVVHKAFVEVNEEGTEAAAATGSIMMATSVMEPKPPVTFRADHPFVFVIRDRRTNSILFTGRLCDPRG